MKVMDWGVALASGVILSTAQPGLAQQGPVGAFADTAVRDLIGARVMTSDGSNVGEVERVVQHQGKILAVVGVGGFLGFGEHDVAVPLTDFAQGEAGLDLAAYTEEDLKALVAWGGEGSVMPLDVTVAGDPAPAAELDPLTPVPPEAPVTQ